MFIEPRRAVSVDELLRGMIVQSGNDASIALAELVAGSEEAFVARMNAEAARLGMTNTRFTNVTGLSNPQHYSTAADLAKVAAALIRDYPEYYPLYSQKEFRYNNITQPNRNRLLWSDPHVDGMKTGHTDAAGWCLIATALRGDRRVLAVVLGASSDAARASEAQKLLNWGFQAFDTVQLYQSGKQVTTLRVWKGALPEVPAGFLADRYLTLPKGKADKLAVTMQAEEPLVAPIARAQRVGTVKVALEGKPVAEFPMIALEEVPRGELLRPRRGIRYACGSRNELRASHGHRPDRLPQRQVPAGLAGARLGARPRLHLRRRRVRARARLRPRAVPPAAAPRAPRAQPRRHPPRQSAHQRAVGVDHPRPHRAPAVRRPGRLLPGHARRRQARPLVSRRACRRRCS